MGNASVLSADNPSTTSNGDGARSRPESAEPADAFLVERIAEAVIRKIDEREKINLLADAVIRRLREPEGVPSADSAGPVPGVTES